MKKPTNPIAQNYPYLAYWIEAWGEMEVIKTIDSLEEDYKNNAKG